MQYRHKVMLSALILFPVLLLPALIRLINDPRGERDSQRLRDAKRIGS